MSKETLKANLREIPDFPIPGILFYDVTTLFKNPECLQEILDTLYEMYKDKGITKVVGIESRGFIMGGALAARLGGNRNYPSVGLCWLRYNRRPAYCRHFFVYRRFQPHYSNR